MTVTYLDPSKNSLGKLETDYFNFLADYKPNVSLMSEVIRLELMNLRQSTAHTKTRAEVRGGGRKPWKQKGTGRARHGSRRSPIWVGGGITFGPRNERNWHRKINKSAKVSALKSILADRFLSGKLLISPSLKAEKTKEAHAIIDLLRSSDPKAKIALFYTMDNKHELNGFRNIVGVNLINVANLALCRMSTNTYFVFSDLAAKSISERLQSTK